MPVKQNPLTCRGHTRPVVDIDFSSITPDGSFFISACKDSVPMLRDAETGDWIGSFQGHTGAVWGCALNDTATLAATGSADFTAKIWDATSGDALATFKHKHIVKSVDLGKLSPYLLTGCNDKKVRIFDTKSSSSEPLSILEGCEKRINRVKFINNDQLVVAGGEDGKLRVWDARGNILTSETDLGASIEDISVRGSNLIVASGNSVSVRKMLDLSEVNHHETSCKCLSADAHPSDDMIIWGGEDNVLRFWQEESKDEYRDHFGPIHCVRFSPDGEVFASCSEDGTVRLWQTHPGREYGLWLST